MIGGPKHNHRRGSHVQGDGELHDNIAGELANSGLGSSDFGLWTWVLGLGSWVFDRWSQLILNY